MQNLASTHQSDNARHNPWTYAKRSTTARRCAEKAASGAGQDELLLANRNNTVPTQWLRDGSFIVYSELDPKTKWDIWVLPMETGTGRKPVAFLHSEFNELFGQLSPDSHWMAFTSDRSGRREV